MNILFVYSNIDSEIQALRFSRYFKGSIKYGASYNSKFIYPDINLNFFYDCKNKNHKKHNILQEYLRLNNIDVILTDYNMFMLRFASEYKFPFYYYYLNEGLDPPDDNHLAYVKNAIKKIALCIIEPFYDSKDIAIPYHDKSISSKGSQFSFYCFDNNKVLMNKVKNIQNIQIFSEYNEYINNSQTELIFSDEYYKSIGSSDFLISEDRVTFMIDMILNKRYVYVLEDKQNTNIKRLIKANLCEYVDKNTNFERTFNNFVDMSGYKYLHEEIGK